MPATTGHITESGEIVFARPSPGEPRVHIASSWSLDEDFAQMGLTLCGRNAGVYPTALTWEELPTATCGSCQRNYRGC